MLATIRSRLHRAAQRGQVKRASAAYVVTDGIIRAAQGMRKQAQEPQNMPVPRAGNWRQYLPMGWKERRVMDFGRKAWNTFQHMPNALQSFPQQSAAPRVSPPADLPRFFKADKPNALQSFPQFSDVSPFPPTRVAARLNALALAPAVHKRWSQETSARDYVDWLTAQRQQK